MQIRTNLNNKYKTLSFSLMLSSILNLIDNKEDDFPKNKSLALHILYNFVS